MFMVGNILLMVVAALHVYFLVLECFLWTKPIGLRIFRQPLARAIDTYPLAKNQGVYNGFLAVGLIWGILQPDPNFAFQIKTFFLTCVVIAGITGAITVNKRIFFIQAIPALLAMAAIALSK
jgi:putative membrane protein